MKFGFVMLALSVSTHLAWADDSQWKPLVVCDNNSAALEMDQTKNIQFVIRGDKNPQAISVLVEQGLIARSDVNAQNNYVRSGFCMRTGQMESQTPHTDYPYRSWVAMPFQNYFLFEGRNYEASGNVIIYPGYRFRNCDASGWEAAYHELPKCPGALFN